MRLRLFAATSALLACSLAAHADVIDQQSTTYDLNFTGSTSAGQSFTPGLNSISFATFYLATNGPASTVAIKLFEGSGYGGSLLGTSQTEVVNSTSETAYTFDFSPIALTPGNMYTLQIALLAGGTLNEAESNTDVYAGGTGFRSSGAVHTGHDLTFSEGTLSSAATPEPSSLALLGTGVLGVIGAARRRFQS